MLNLPPLRLKPPRVQEGQGTARAGLGLWSQSQFAHAGRFCLTARGGVCLGLKIRVWCLDGE